MYDRLLYQLALSLIPGIGCVHAKKLIAYCGSEQAVFSEKKRVLQKIPGISDATIAEINLQSVLPRAEKELEFIRKHKLNAVSYLDADYPQRLKNCNDSPLLLFYKGVSCFNVPKVLSIVGTRHASPYGKEITQQLITQLAERNHQLLIVSGMALGIDIVAHRTALKNQLPTVGVLAHGLDRIYPSNHRETAAEICSTNGALLTEFITETQPDKFNFVRRNRIVAGMADATLVIEAPLKSGSLITAELANSYNRDVLAVPGRTTDNVSRGCNMLIKTQRANLVESVNDIEYLLGWEQPSGKPVQKQLFIELTPEEQHLSTILATQGDLPIDLISREAAMPVSQVSAHLLNLEFKGMVQCLPGKVFRLTK